MYTIFSSFEDNKEIYEFYSTHKNYYIEDGNDESDEIWIFFSSHGLYYPTTIENFREKIVVQDYYEWRNISHNPAIHKCANKFIYVRDVYKNWCLEGINGIYNTPERLAELLREVVKEKKVVTVGSSAGGTMAIMMGCMLEATRIYAFSPQVSLSRYSMFHTINDFDHYKKVLPEYIELKAMINRYKGNLYYFYPNESPEDVDQFEALKDSDIPMFFSINFQEHGLPIYGASLIETLSMPENKLKKLYEKYSNKRVSRERFLFDTCGISKAVANIIGHELKKYIRR